MDTTSVGEITVESSPELVERMGGVGSPPALAGMISSSLERFWGFSHVENCEQSGRSRDAGVRYQRVVKDAPRPVPRLFGESDMDF